MSARQLVRPRYLFLSVAVLLLAAVLLVQPTFAAPSAAKPTPRPRGTQTPTQTPTRSPTNTPTNTPTPLPTNTPTTAPTNTPTPLPTNTPTPSPTYDPAQPHKSITDYKGPQTCVACHTDEGNAAAHSEHVLWQGKWPHINTYCTAPEPSEYQCLGCHASTGKVNNATMTANDVDCLMCHSDSYSHTAGPLTGSITVTDWQGTTKTLKIPEKNAQGDYTLLPVVPATTTLLQVAQNPQLPTRATCLKCHAKAGGADGAKRGDISSANANPSLTSDVHMSPQGGNFACQTCHVTTDHQIPGKGIDLRISEGGGVKQCADCHSPKPHGDSKLNSHTDHVACQTCHIPVYGKDVATEMSRDWTFPKWNSATNQWVPEDTKALNVKPQYTFWNGTSYVYNLKDPINPNPDGTFTVSKANGAINDAGSKLYPIKLHTANQPRHNDSGRLVAYDTRWNFLTGKYEEAAQRGVTFMGLTGGYSWVTTKAEQLITHGVEPKINALSCDTCHQSTDRMDLPALGYMLKGPQSQVCTQCHSQKPPKPFYDMHDKHVTDKRYDCSWCHAFSRPERGLRLP